jgi:F-type H+-transporting ATPase subunit b
MNKFLTPAFALLATPALAAEGPFFDLKNTDFIVLCGFLVFMGILFYFNVPSMLMGMLDKRAAEIKSELDEAKALREDAQTLLATYERKQKEVQAQADRIVEKAKADAEAAAEQAKVDLKDSIARRLVAAEDQIASANAAAVKDVRDSAIEVAIGAARAVVAKQSTAASLNKSIDDGIDEVAAKLH